MKTDTRAPCLERLFGCKEKQGIAEFRKTFEEWFEKLGTDEREIILKEYARIKEEFLSSGKSGLSAGDLEKFTLAACPSLVSLEE